MTSTFYRKRLISGLFAGAFGLFIVGTGGLCFALSICLIVHFALVEYFRMTEIAGIRPASKTTLLSCQILLIATYLSSTGFLSEEFVSALLPLSGLAICGWLLLQPITGSIADIAASILGLFYLGYLPSYWIRLRNLTQIDFSPSVNIFLENNSNLFTEGMLITLISCLMIVVSDIGSFYFGRICGRHPLSPISPSKTIEGAFLGCGCSVFVGLLFASMIQFDIWGLLFGAIWGIIVSFFAIIGDLIESMMKRDAGIKDSGNALPGHGGILDRIDSYIFVPSIVFFLAKFFINIV